MKKRTNIAFLWHMHQPFYKDDLRGNYLMPWVRLHGVKDYFPMAELLNRSENMKATFNLVPVLIEQIKDYVDNEASDTLLDLTVKKASQLTGTEKAQILEHFFKVNSKRFIEPNARYSSLYVKRGTKPLKGSNLKQLLYSFSEQDLLDLQVLFNLSWFHSITVEDDSNLQELLSKDSYTEDDKVYIVKKQKEVLSKILPLYKKLQHEKRIEISTTPYYHPILPLLCDTSVAKVSIPGMPLPKKFSHPEDAKWQINEAVRYYTEEFGMPPAGMWPSEGSVSDKVLDLMAEAGIKWIATDEDILFKSLSLYDSHYQGKGLLDRRLIYRPYKSKRHSGDLNIIFRDKNLSDIISFNYNSWDPASAASDLLGHFKNIDSNFRRDMDRGMVTIVMDGENAWDYYKDNGRAFFETIYSEIDKDDNIGSTTISGFLHEAPAARAITKIFPASWINHNFEIWIGQEQDNMSWDYLSKVRADLVRFTKGSDSADEKTRDRIKKAWREFYIAEGSDWNWWYGGKLNSGSNNPFDRLYRMHLANIYKILKKPVPDFIKESIS